MKTKKLKIGTRLSPLALKQVEEIEALLRDHDIPLQFEVVKFKTAGDQDQTTPLTSDVADDFFTDTLDQALLTKQIDLAVHSAKDLPQRLHEGIDILALTKSIDPTDAFVGKTAFKDLPAGSKVGTSSPLRQKMVKELRPDVKVVDVRGTIEERIKFLEKGKIDGLIVATCALKRLGLESRIKEILPWESTALQGQLAVTGRSKEQELRDIFSSLDVRKSFGSVKLVGAGPGDPDLITQKGIKALEQCDCVFYDYLISKELLKYTRAAEHIYVGKRKGEHSLTQAKLNKMLKDRAVAGKNIVRLKGGDPLIFGRGAEEIEYLRAYHIPVDVIPGVSSATSIPSLLSVPLTARGVSSSVAFLSGHGENEQGQDSKLLSIPNVQTIVFLMGITKIDIILKSLKKAKWKDQTPAMVISRGTHIDEKIVQGTLADIKKKITDARLKPPALIIVGDTVQFYQERFHQKKKFLYTGTNPQKYQSLGDIVHLPMIQISKAKYDPKEMHAIFENFDKYKIVIFTSRFAVLYFLIILREFSIPLEKLEKVCLITIGKETTNALEQFDLNPEISPRDETSQGLLDHITRTLDVKDKHILFPRSSLPNPFLENQLTKMGAKIDVVSVYENTKPGKRQLPTSDIESIVFTSPSTVRNFLEDYGEIPQHWHIVSRGPLTSQCLEDAGYLSEELVP